MNEITIVIGGCRSGKSRYALDLAGKLSENKKIFIATCLPQDEEMRQRVARHQKDRGKTWITLEVPIDLPETVTQNSSRGDVILVDCLTLWISNLLTKTRETSEREVIESVDNLTRALQTVKCPVILVSNEVGTGIVPENQLARQFRDIMGMANQRVAACADGVIWMVAGIPVKIKGSSLD
jgi:adenosylcobinamide kinase/adenosylcobinamide-phosphate guanylyltransferase